MATLQQIPTEAQFQSLTTSAPAGTLFILYFQAPWAAPCKQMTTVLSTLASTYPASAPVHFLSIDAEELPEVSETYDVTAVPFVVVQRDGKVLDSLSGSDAGKVRGLVEKHAGAASGGVAGQAGIPPPLSATPQAQPNGAVNGSATKDLSAYAPREAAPQSSSPESKEELNERLAKLVKAAPVMLFMKGTPSAPQCGFSRQLVSILRENQVKYGFFNILADDEVRQGLKVFSDWPTFPQLYTDGELVGGLDIVREEMDANPDFFKPFSAAPKADGETVTA